jgi:cell division protein FtsB
MAANPYWNDARLNAQRPAARALTLPSPALEAMVETVAPRGAVRRRELALPSWVVFCMIMLATFAVCVTVTMRTHAGMRTAEQEHEQLRVNVESTRAENEALRQKVELMRQDPHAQAAAAQAIEIEARERLNMLKSNEVVVPLN